jgi:tetratricopeptide (TPR) repeat protein
VIRRILPFLFLAGVSAFAQTSTQPPVPCSKLLTWMTAGIPSQRLLRLTQDQGIAFSLETSTREVLSRAGADAAFIDGLEATAKRHNGMPCGGEIGQAAALVHQRKYDEAEVIVRKLTAASPNDADLHLALGYLRQRQGDMDEAFDAYADAKDLNPEFPEIHNGLSYVFSQSNDPENAIAEARTALSIDPKNADAYRYLGLGLYVAENHGAALHVLLESRALDPNHAETYYDIGLVQTARGELAAAVDSYREAIHLDPQLEEARSNLNTLLRQMAEEHRAIAAGRKPASTDAVPSN